MKKSLFTIIATIALLAATKVSAAFTNTTVLTANFQITAIAITNYEPTTVISAGTTNETVRSFTNTLSTSNILQFIATEFETNFPSGARLVFSVSTFTFQVVDATGKVLLDASSNPNDSDYFLILSNNVAGAPLTTGYVPFFKTTYYPNGNIQNHPANLLFSDYLICYRDSHTNNFHFGGLLSYSYNKNVTSTNTIYPSENLTISGPGGGYMLHPKLHVPAAVVFPKAQVTATGQKLTVGAE